MAADNPSFDLGSITDVFGDDFDLQEVNPDWFEDEMLMDEMGTPNEGPGTAPTEATEPTMTSEGMTSAATSDSRHFVTLDADEIESIVINSKAQSTNKNTSWAIKIFKQWLALRDKSPCFETLSPQELNNTLKVFYAEVRNSNGQYYSKSSYVGIRSAIHRHLRQPPYERSFNMLQDQEFVSANNVFMGMLRKIKKLGLDVSTHYEPISEGDLVKIRSNQSVDNPVSLQKKVWFDLTLGFGRRGVENQRELTRNSFRVEIDDVGCEFITSTHSELTKNHRGDLRDSNEPRPRIYATGTASCPVASFKQYISKLHPENTALFQRPRKLTNTSPDTHWYTAQALGHNSLSKMMKLISEEAKLSKIYTNHCVRATTVTLLSHAGVECREIMKLTGHRNEQSLMSYNCDSSSAQKRRYSAILQGGGNITPAGIVSQHVNVEQHHTHSSGLSSGFLQFFNSTVTVNNFFGSHN